MGLFDGAGKEAGLEIWRIEALEPKPYAKADYGTFYKGDSYIVLKTTAKPGWSSLTWDIYFWLGGDSSQDEQGAAALMTVELDDYLGGAPVQHREVEGHESKEFSQLFKKIVYKKGGVASGFKTVVRGVYETTLWQVKGSRSCKVSECALDAASLNAGDVFILETQDVIYQWNGKEANKKEKAKGLEVSTDIRAEERGGKCKLEVVEMGAEPAAFWAALGGEKPIAAAVSDTTTAASGGGNAKLFKVSDSSGSMTTTEVASGALAKSMLVADDVMILDAGNSIFVWIGKGANAEEKKSGMKVGSDFITSQGRPAHTQVTKVMDGAETPVFKSNFEKWADIMSPVDFSATPRGNVTARRESKSAGDQVAGMMEKMGSFFGGNRRKSMTVAEGGTTEVWRIENFEAVPLDQSLYGQFFAGDSYIVKYTYKEGSKECYLIYFWQGAKSTADEKGASALLAKNMDDQLGGAATQVRVVMGKEPSHFVRLFKGKMVIHSGGKASAFKNAADSDSYDDDGVSLYHVRGTDADNTRAVQVEEAAKCLNAGDCFVLLTPGTMYVWKGGGANETELATAQTVATSLAGRRETTNVNEGEEPEAFWEKLGGKAEYPSAKEIPEASREPLLFACTNATGTFEVDPIFDFSQADLEEEDVYLLDCFTTVFIWIGSAANEQEKTMALETAKVYVQAQGYSEDTAICQVTSGNEPALFTCNFLGWDGSAKKKFVDPYEAKLAAAMAANPKEEDAPAPAPAPAPAAAGAGGVSGDYKPPESHRQTIEALKNGVPDGVDPTKKEQYLSDADFEAVMKSPRAEFNAMKPWKQAQVKKAAGLF